MSGKGSKLKIKRSDGRVQYVTQDELEELNFQRKLKDQSTLSAKASSPFPRLIMLCGFSLIIAVAILWFSRNDIF